MAQIEVSEKMAAELQQLAEQEGRALQELVGEAMHAYLSLRLYEPDLAPAQIERMRHSLAQSNRGERVSDEEVEAFFDDWEKDLASR